MVKRWDESHALRKAFGHRPSATKSRSAPDKIIWVHQLWNVLRPRCDNRADIYGHFTFVTLELVELMASNGEQHSL